MCLHMKLQIAHLIKGFVTKVTRIWPLTSVNEGVVPQIPLLMEAFPTNMANKLFNVTMGLDVSFQG